MVLNLIVTFCQILIDLNGNSIDNLSGLINFDNTIYKTSEKTYKLSSFNLDLDQATSTKNIELNSSIANVALNGKYNLSSLPNAFKQYLNESALDDFIKNSRLQQSAMMNKSKTTSDYEKEKAVHLHLVQELKPLLLKRL